MTLPSLHTVVWTLADAAALKRQIDLACAKHPEPGISEAIYAHFWKQLQSHPLEWPSSSRPASEHTWRFGRVMVRYRLVPDAQSVEILSVSSSTS
jgi:hypothetical protein